MPQFQTYVKQLKELQSHSGCEASVFRKFIKTCDRVERKMPQVRAEYERCLVGTGRIRDLAELLLAHFTENQAVDFAEITKQLKKYRGNFFHEFLLSSQDKEFRDTYDHLLVMLPEYAKTGAQKLLVQSEVENLLSPLEEALEKSEPDFFALTYFGMNRDEKELYEINAERKRTMIVSVLQVELVRPFINTVRERGMDTPENFAKLESVAAEMTGQKPVEEVEK